MKTKIAPDQILDTKDRGDDTQARFRYQNSCACYASINMLIDENCSYNEILCEQHEDILLKLNSGKFAGIQIKTRDTDYGPFNIKDDAIIKSISRFVELESKFPTHFEYYVISSNVGFDNAKATDIRILIHDAKQNNIDLHKRSSHVLLIKNISSTLKVKEETVIATIKKIRIRKPMPHISDIDAKILSVLGTYKELAKTYLDVVKSILNEIIILHYNAGSLNITDPAYEYYIFRNEHDEEETKLIIDSKRITKNMLGDIVTRNLSNESLIQTQTKHSVLDFKSSTKVLESKLNAGYINIENINIIKEDKYAFEAFMTEKFYKDEEHATSEYNHYRHMMLSESQDSYDRFNKEAIFGMDMLINVKDRIKERFKYDKEHLFNCTPEHLLGMVAILTEECQVWWSDKFEV